MKRSIYSLAALQSLAALLGLLAFTVLPASADTAPLLLVFNTSGSATGQAANVRVVVTDSTGAVLVASTNTPGGTAFAESSVIPGEYSAPATITYTAANLPLKAEYTITGTTPLVSGVAVYLTERAALNVAGYTAALPGTIASTNTQTTAANQQANAQAATLTTVPAAGTTTGTAETLTFQQSQALLLSLSAGGVTNTAPAASSTGTVTYYLVGRPKTTANVVAVSSPTFDATRTISGRTVLIQQPFPAL